MLENCKSFPNNPQLKVKVGKERSTSVGTSPAHYNMDQLETLAFVKTATATVTALKDFALIQRTISSFDKMNR